MRDVAYELLNKPEWFTCEPFDCRLRIDVCLGRIKANTLALRRESFDHLPYPTCYKCIQGEKNIQQAMDKVGHRGKPKRGRGQRNETCEFYNICLDLAAKKDWKSFNCESCYYYGGYKMTEKVKNKRICETEGCENKTISPKHPFCASCLAKKSNAARAAKKKVLTKPNKTNTKGRGKPEKASLVAISSFEINFNQYKTLFDQINDLATEQIRTPEQQILYLLKTHPNLVKVS